MNTENSKTSDPCKLLLNFLDKINDEYLALSNLNMYYTWKNKKKNYRKIIINDILSPTWNNKFELPDGLYFVSDIQDYFDFIIKNETVAGNPPIRIFLNKIESRILLKFKTRYYLELLSSETPFNTLLGSTKNMANKKCALFRTRWSSISPF